MFSSHRWRDFVVALALSLWFVSIAPGASADGGRPEQSARGVPDAPLAAPGSTQPTPAELVDLAGLAKQEGITLQAAIDTYGWHPRFAELVGRLREKYPNDFAGARIEAGADSQAWVGFRANAPAAATAQLKAFSKPVAVHESRGFTEAQLDAELEQAHFAIWNRKDLVSYVSSGYDIATGVITVQVEPLAPSSELAAQSRSAVETDLRAALPAEAANWKVELSVVDSIPHTDDYIHGGGRLEYQSSSDTACTAGFGVRKGANPRGMTTAGHCTDALDYSWMDAGAPWTRLTFQGQHIGKWGDVQWHTSSTQVDDDFYYDWYKLRDTNAVGYALDGQELASFGMTNGLTFDTVYERNHCKGDTCHLTLTNHRRRAGGDSGGPWFWGNTAYGIHQGSKNYPYPWTERDAFTPVTYLDEALNIQVFMYENCGC